MIEQTNKTWYVARRGELLAEQFLLELEPSSLSSMQNMDMGIDYMAFFPKADETLVVIAIEVKITQQRIHGHYSISSSRAQKLLNMNIPVFLVVVNVKENDIYFNWIRDAVSAEQETSLERTSTCTLSLRPAASEEREKLKRETIQQ